MASRQRGHHPAGNSADWPSLLEWLRWQKHQCTILDLLPQTASVENLHLMKIHLTHNLPRGINILCYSGIAAPVKKTLVVVVVIARFLWLLHGNMLPIYCPYNIGDIPSGSKLHLFPVTRVVGQPKYSSWNLARMVWQTWGRIYRWWFGQPTSDTARWYMLLLLPYASELFPVSFQLLSAS